MHTSPALSPEPDARKARIRDLNDVLRKGHCQNGTVLLTKGVNALGYEAVLAVAEAVKSFDAFTEDNDPHLERDFGSVEVQGEKIFWKIDPYDLSLQYGSPDPSDAAVTHRVLTIMLASECAPGKLA